MICVIVICQFDVFVVYVLVAYVSLCFVLFVSSAHLLEGLQEVLGKELPAGGGRPQRGVLHAPGRRDLKSGTQQLAEGTVFLRPLVQNQKPQKALSQKTKTTI